MAEDIQSKATEMVKKLLTVGVGAFFLTEESLRSLVSEFKLPKELLTAILESAGKSKDEFVKTLSREVMGQVLERIEPQALIQEILEKNEIKFEVKMTLKPKKKIADE